MAQSLNRRHGRRQVLTLTTVFDRNGQAQDAEPRTARNPRARTRHAFPARGVRVNQLFAGELAWPRRTSVAVFPRKQNPSPRPSRMMCG